MGYDDGFYKPTSGQSAAAFLVGVLGFFIQIFALTSGWHWFLVPLGVAEVGFWQVAGILIFCRLILGTRRPVPVRLETDWWEDKLRPVMTALFGLFLLWLFWRMQ